MSAETKVTDSNQTQVPSAIRAKHGVAPGDIVVWDETADGRIEISFRRRHTLADLVGVAPGASAGDAVVAKKRAQRRG